LKTIKTLLRGNWDMSGPRHSGGLSRCTVIGRAGGREAGGHGPLWTMEVSKLHDLQGCRVRSSTISHARCHTVSGPASGARPSPGRGRRRAAGRVRPHPRSPCRARAPLPAAVSPGVVRVRADSGGPRLAHRGGRVVQARHRRRTLRVPAPVRPGHGRLPRAQREDSPAGAGLRTWQTG
jgi:hypothetical protein